jgi:phosphatidylethanolamine/phosphatidyl-N-methylethanolamine N-methyltransferase
MSIMLIFEGETLIVDANDRNRVLYQRLAKAYDLAARLPAITRPRARMFTLADIRSGQRVLVVGVGTGQDLAHLPADTEVTGIDVSPAMLRARVPAAKMPRSWR